MSNSLYILKTGKEAIESLETQHNSLSTESYNQLRKAGLKEGQIVWDVGCGTGTMTEYLAKTVGEFGKVYALDVSSEQLDVAEERILKAGLNNVVFIKGDITKIENLQINHADIVYSRLILMHLQNPKDALRKMYSLLKPNGVLLLQESTISTSSFSKENIILDNYFQTLIDIGKHKGVDFNVGKKLPFLCSEIGFTKVEYYTSQNKYTAAEAKHILLSRLLEWQDEALKSMLASKSEIDSWKNEILGFPDDISFYHAGAEQTHVLVWKE